MSYREGYDAALLGILQNEGQIENFLDVFFSFLYRRTDFFRHLFFPTDKCGFRPGVAKKLVLSTFKKYEAYANEKNVKLERDYKRYLEEENVKAAINEIPLAMREEVVMELSPQQIDATPLSSPNEDINHPTSTGITAPKSHSPSEVDVTHDVTLNYTVDAKLMLDGSTETEKQTIEVVSTGTKNEKLKNEDDNSEDDSELARLQRVYQANPESYNGAIRDGYLWSQSITDLDVRVKIPSFVKKGKDVEVVIDRKHIKVSYRDTDTGTRIVAVDGDLCFEVHRDESVWSLVPGEHVHVNMEKIQEKWWDALMVGEPKISVRKIDPSRPITDLGDEEQAKVQEMMFNERQKRMGLPQSHEQKTHEMLRKAWDAEGSPFKGQPFDPSKLNISTGNFS